MNVMFHEYYVDLLFVSRLPISLLFLHKMSAVYTYSTSTHCLSNGMHPSLHPKLHVATPTIFKAPPNLHPHLEHGQNHNTSTTTHPWISRRKMKIESNEIMESTTDVMWSMVIMSHHKGT